MKKYNIGASIVFLLLGILVIVDSSKFDKYVNGTPGPGFWPRTLGFLLVFVSLILLFYTIFTKKEMVKHLIDMHSPGFRQVLVLFGLMILFGVGLNYLGFLPASVLFVAAVTFLLGNRKPVAIILTSVGITAIIYIIFVVGLGLVMPVGKLFY